MPSTALAITGELHVEADLLAVGPTRRSVELDSRRDRQTALARPGGCGTADRLDPDIEVPSSAQQIRVPILDLREVPWSGLTVARERVDSLPLEHPMRAGHWSQPMLLVGHGRDDVRGSCRATWQPLSNPGGPGAAAATRLRVL